MVRAVSGRRLLDGLGGDGVMGLRVQVVCDHGKRLLRGSGDGCFSCRRWCLMVNTGVGSVMRVIVVMLVVIIHMVIFFWMGVIKRLDNMLCMMRLVVVVVRVSRWRSGCLLSRYCGT